MLTTICKRFAFDAAHSLPNVPATHKCHNMHGHTYAVEIGVAGEPGERTGWLVDFADLAAAWDGVAEHLDHRCLNHVEGLTNPTAELVAAWIWRHLVERVPRLVSVRLYESTTTWAEVRG